MNVLDKKIKYSIDLIKKHEDLSLSLSDKGFNLAFSGGKDSIVLYELTKYSGVKFSSNMQLTTVDPPELLNFIRLQYPDVILNRPKISLFDLIVKKGSLPTRQIRYCCAELKEIAGINTVTEIGIRAQESPKRAKRKEFTHSCISGYDKFLLSPIFNWTFKDVWTFIRYNNLKYPDLYNTYFHRIGCIFCPMASVKTKQIERILYPRFENAYKKAIKKLIIEKGKYSNLNHDVDLIFEWWISNDSIKNFLQKRKQLKLNF